MSDAVAPSPELIETAWAMAEKFMPPLSPLLSVVKDRMMAIKGDSLRLDYFDDLVQRIGRHTGQWVDEPVFIGRYEGEWHVSNADVMTWSRVVSFRFATQFPWRRLTSPVTEAIEGKRRWQAFERFTRTGVTREHKLLAARLNWDFSLSRGDGVSLYVQGKRPFGNSDIEGDVADAVGWPQPWLNDDDWDGDRPIEFTEKAWDLFEELQFAVPMILRESAVAPSTPDFR